MMRPRPWRFMMGAADCAQRNCDFRFTFMMWSHCSSVSSSNLAAKNMPALLTRMSRRCEFVFGGAEEFLHVGAVGDVGLDGQGAAPCGFEFLDQLFGFGFRGVVADDDVGAFGGQAQGDAAADAFGGAGD